MVQKNTLKEKLVIITGPTAVGKSGTAIELAKNIGGEIIGADSVQIFKGLNIGSGKITESEAMGIKHHMIDILEPQEEYSVSDYVCNVKQIITDILSRGRMPIMVGGTALYINCLLNGHNFAEAPKNEAIREKYNTILKEKGKDILYELLLKVDPESANRIAPNDTKRVIRALEIFEITGKPKSQATITNIDCGYDYRLFILHKDRKKLYEDINSRVEKMFCLGLANEVQSLLKFKDCQSMQAIGYKEIVDCLLNNGDLEEAKELIKMRSRRYAKRQLTFLKGMNAEKVWIDTENPHIMSDIISKI